MKSKFFSLVDYDALNLWLNIVASGQDRWTLDEATEFFGEEIKVHLPRLLSSNFLSGSYSEFWIPSFPEFSQLILEETFITIMSTSQVDDHGEPISTDNLESKLRAALERYEKHRISNYTNMKMSLEQSIKDSINELEQMFKEHFQSLQGEDGTIVPQLNPLDVLDYLQQMKTSMKNTMMELQEQSKLQIQEIIDKANAVYMRALSNNTLGEDEEKSFSDALFDTFNEALEKNFVAFKRRGIASIELFKLDVGKLSKRQIELINSLEAIIGQIVDRSISNLGNNTSKILDYIFINLRQSLDSLTGNIAQSVQESEDHSKEGIENLVSSVFTINRKVVEELIEALNILSQSASKMKSGLNKNLEKIEASIQEQVESSVEQLEASVDDIRQIQNTTNTKLLNASQMNEEANKKLLEEMIFSIEDTFQSIQNSLEERFNTAKDSFLGSSKLEDFAKDSQILFEEGKKGMMIPTQQVVRNFLNQLDAEYVIIPKSKVASITPEASSFVNSNISSASDVAASLGLDNMINESLQEGLSKLSLIHSNSLKEMVKYHGEIIKKTSDFIGTLGEYLQAELQAILKTIKTSLHKRIEEIRMNSEQLKKELENDLQMGFTFIYDSIDPINMRLMHFKEIETPEFFEISRDKVVGIADVISTLINRIYTQAERNRDKLNDQIQITEMILKNQIEALKVSVMSQISGIVTKNKNDLLSSIEVHRSQIAKDIDNVRSLIGDIVQEELDLPVREFGMQLSKIEESILSMEQITSKEIETLRNEIHALLRRLQTQINGINSEITSKLEMMSSRGLDELSTIRMTAQNTLQLNFSEVESAQQLQISDLGSYLSSNLKEQISKIQKLNSLGEGGLSYTIRSMMNQVQKRLEDLYLDSIAFLNEMQERNSISMIYGDITDLTHQVLTSVQNIDLEGVKMLIHALSQITGRPSIVV